MGKDSPMTADLPEEDEALELTRDDLVADDDDATQREDIFEPFRDVPVGTNDPNIVGDVGPTDVAPGKD